MDAATLDVLVEWTLSSCAWMRLAVAGTSAENAAGGPLEFVPVQAENIENHDAFRTPGVLQDAGSEGRTIHTQCPNWGAELWIPCSTSMKGETEA